MVRRDAIDRELLRKLNSLDSSNLDMLYLGIPCTLIGRLKQFCPDWDDIILEDSWRSLVEQGLAKDIPLKVLGNYNQLNCADQFLTDKGIEVASRIF